LSVWETEMVCVCVCVCACARACMHESEHFWMLCCVGWIISSCFKWSYGFTFRVKQPKTSLMNCLILKMWKLWSLDISSTTGQWHTVTSQKTWIFNNTTVRISNPTLCDNILCITDMQKYGELLGICTCSMGSAYNSSFNSW